MARRHWRFVVRDQHGYAIQNAKVNVYQPGTTTAFLGTAYNAASGGSAVTNPFTTNDQGEVQAWFDTEQTIDVAVDDNTDAAYRAVEGSAAAFSFAAFTEADRIELAPEDIVSDLVNHGSSVHDTTVSDNPHGAADHTNITRMLWLGAEQAALIDGATAASLGAAPNNVRTIQLDDAVTEGASWTFQVPDDWDSGNLFVQPVFAPSATVAASAVRWSITAKRIGAGIDVTSAGVGVTFTGTTETHTANLVYNDPSTDLTFAPLVAGETYLINVRRVGGDALDTLNASIVHLLGVIIRYTANQ